MLTFELKVKVIKVFCGGLTFFNGKIKKHQSHTSLFARINLV